jgi:hypothetical protein
VLWGQVNVGCNYNRPKVAKFLVTLVVTRMKDLTVWFVSCVYSGVNSILLEDTGSSRMGQKDPEKLYWERKREVLVAGIYLMLCVYLCS